MPIGNDVVDLRDPETFPGALHPRFDARVFTPEERLALRASPEVAGRRRWRLWAAKEAAYKAARKLDPMTIWSPVGFALRPSRAWRDASGPREWPQYGEVDCSAGTLRVEWVETREWIHALAWTESAWVPCILREVDEGSAGRESDPSRAVRQLACERMANWLERPMDQLQVCTGRGRSARIPELRIASEGVTLDLSLSHHGQLLAFACVPPEDDGFAIPPRHSRAFRPAPSAAESPVRADGRARRSWGSG